MPARVEFWTDERVEKLIDYWVNRRMSATRIGMLLGCSRNMAVGKAWRLKLEGGTPMELRPKPPRAPRGPRKPRPSRAKKQAPRKPDIILPPSREHRCTLMELVTWTTERTGTCRFPTWQTPTDRFTPIPSVDEAFYCGDPVTTDGPYCPWHTGLTHETASARAARMNLEKMQAKTNVWMASSKK